MTSLIQVLQDNGVDDDTALRLTSALSSAEETSEAWSDIGLSLLPQAPRAAERLGALATAEPDVARRTLPLLAVGGLRAATQAAQRMARVLQWSNDGLGCCDAHALTQLSQVCREMRDLTRTDSVWEPRVRALCATWNRSFLEETWRRQFFQLVRPRLDGVYVAQCGYTIQSTGEWAAYRRYVRLFPPDSHGVLRALVLQDSGSLELALEVLTQLDPVAQLEARLQAALQQQEDGEPPAPGTWEHVRSQVFVAHYSIDNDQVKLQYLGQNGQFSMTLKVRPRAPGGLLDQLDWVEYALTSPTGESMPFKLGRNQQGEPLDPNRDHYPPYVLRCLPSLEYLL